MKKIRWVFSIVLLLLFVHAAEAQILKKIQKKIQDNVTRKAVDKSTDTTDEEKQKTMDKTLNADAIAMAYGKNKVDPSLVPDFYLFSWNYSLEIQSENEKAMIMDYFLEPNAEYFGFKMGESDEVFMVIDSKYKLMITAFEQGKEKVAMASRMPDYSEITAKENVSDGFSYKPLPNKIIMGYNCKGIEATSADFEMVFYYTNEAKVNFSDVFRSQQKQKTPDVLKRYFKTGDRPLMMTLSMKDLKDKRKITTMKCVVLERKTRKFLKSDYKFM
ncbi:hypothetical protein [Flavobacterium sandaracinum]|uniref:DUF4412 domain-containing protein n=1 Tax=Flavobacterium sandaracinum TaxID=2541733 RepID=A0A4R5CWK8_9FLAO|nr:hypothetical protein [Flavobacterium sandaracinum]TDE05152.1 hypothetical protein E0F91_06535 [Flavobacterium sandaracinum]